MNIFIVLFLSLTGIFSKTNIYDIKVKTVEGRIFDLTQCKGKKIVVATIRPSSLQNEKFHFFDSIQKANPNLIIIAIPATDFTAFGDTISSINYNSSLNLILVAPSFVKKSAGKSQHPLMTWLTSLEQNNHFDAEVKTDDQLYFVNESGVLYAILEKGAPLKVIAKTLSAIDFQE